MKQLLFKLGKRAVFWGLVQAFKYVDKDKDGKVSQEEIEYFVDDVRKLLTLLKKKTQK